MRLVIINHIIIITSIIIITTSIIIIIIIMHIYIYTHSWLAVLRTNIWSFDLTTVSIVIVMFATYNTYTVPFIVKTCIFIVTHIQLPYSHCYRLFQIIQAVDSEQPSWASAGLAVSFWASAPRCFARCPANSWTSGIHTLAVTEPRKHMAKEELLIPLDGDNNVNICS